MLSLYRMDIRIVSSLIIVGYIIVTLNGVVHAQSKTSVQLSTNSTKQQPSCSTEAVSVCVSDLQAVTRNKSSVAFAATEEELNQVCKHLSESMKCVDSFTERCFAPQQRMAYRRLTSGAAQLIDDFCRNESRFRNVYLKHAGCYKMLQGFYNRCSEEFMALQMDLNDLKIDEDVRIRLACCQFSGYTQCTRIAVERHCGVEAADLAEDIIVKAGGRLLYTHCSQYHYNSIACSGEESVHHLQRYVTLAVALVVSVLLLRR